MKKVKSTRRKEQGEATKKKIYETAQKLFSEYGIDDVSIDNIAEAVGVARGTIYVHFESKDALVSSLISGYVDRVDMDYEAFLKTLPLDIPSPDILILLVEKICDVIECSLGFDIMRTLYRVQLTSVSYAQEASSYNRVLYQKFAEVLEKGIRQGEFQASLPVDELSKHLVLAIRGLVYEWCIRYPGFSLKEQTLAHFKILLDGIKA